MVIALVENTVGDKTKLYASTTSDGSFSFSSLIDGYYKLTPSKKNYNFVPETRVPQVNEAVVALDSFIGTPIDDNSGGSGGGGSGGYSTGGNGSSGY